MTTSDFKRSPLRWAGSKRRLLPALVARVPEKYERYVEPFCGSMCLALALNPKRALLGDINSDLIHFYKTVRWRPRVVAKRAAEWPADPETYYKLRDKADSISGSEDRAARFLYLNRYCFNGVYRTNRAGKFNVPRGTHTGVLPDENELVELAAFLRGADLVCADFAALIEDSLSGDFIYLDPPYAGRDVRDRGEYGPNAFKINDVDRLASLLNKASEKGAKILLSYADTPRIREEFASWTIESLSVARNVSGFSKGRKSAEEVLIRNYL